MKARHWIPPQKQKPKNSQVELWKAMKEAERKSAEAAIEAAKGKG